MDLLMNAWAIIGLLVIAVIYVEVAVHAEKMRRDKKRNP